LQEVTNTVKIFSFSSHVHMVSLATAPFTMLQNHPGQLHSLIGQKIIYIFFLFGGGGGKGTRPSPPIWPLHREVKQVSLQLSSL